jgi:hypothetical protein
MAKTHLWTIRQVVSLAMYAVPSTESFLESLAAQQEGGMAALEVSSRAFVVAADVVIARLDALYHAPCVDENGA